MSSYLNPRGPEFPPPRPWEFLAPAIDWLAGCREKYLAFGSGVTAAGRDLAELLNDGSFYTAHLVNIVASAHGLPPDLVRREMLVMVSDGRACLVEDGQIWSAASVADKWPSLRDRAWQLLSDAHTPVITTFQEISERLGCTEASAQTVVWTLCEQDYDGVIYQRYAQHFITGQAPQAAA
jgi:hypothetical protein